MTRLNIDLEIFQSLPKFFQRECEIWPLRGLILKGTTYRKSKANWLSVFDGPMSPPKFGTVRSMYS